MLHVGQLAYEVCCPLCMEENISYNCNHHFDICEQLAIWTSKKHSIALFRIMFQATCNIHQCSSFLLLSIDLIYKLS